MKFLTLLALLLLAFSCLQDAPKEVVSIPKILVAKASKDIVIKNDTAFLKNQKYSGFLYQLYPNEKDTFAIESYYNGLLSGRIKKWYSANQVMEERHYSEGRKNGRQVSFWENGNKKFEFVAKNDAYEGEMKEWTIDGKLIHLANFVNGQEEGTQKLWYDNGKIRANYVIIKGKRYGLLGTKNCKNVSDSIFVVK